MQRTPALGGALAVIGIVTLTIAGGLAHAADPRPPMMAQAMMSMLDTNKDSVVSADEFKAHVETRFAAFDQDHDGQITEVEFKSAHDDMPMGGPKGPPGDDGRGPMANARDEMRAAHQGQMFKTMDTNSDGVISREEFQTREQARFKEMDTNGDGQLSADELSAMPKGGPGGMMRK